MNAIYLVKWKKGGRNVRECEHRDQTIPRNWSMKGDHLMILIIANMAMMIIIASVLYHWTMSEFKDDPGEPYFVLAYYGANARTDQENDPISIYIAFTNDGDTSDVIGSALITVEGHGSDGIILKHANSNQIDKKVSSGTHMGLTTDFDQTANGVLSYLVTVEFVYNGGAYFGVFTIDRNMNMTEGFQMKF
jgi:hypothetical protein